MKIILGGYSDQVERDSFRIEYWYDRHTRLWVVEVFDDTDNSVDCMYAPKSDLEFGISEFAKQYNTNDVQKK